MDYGYEYVSNGGAGVVLMIYMLIFLILGIYELICYIIKGIGLYTIAKRQGAEYPWLAFIPFARTYLQGELGGDIVFKKRSIQNPGIWLVVLPIIQSAVVFVFYLIIFGVIGVSTVSSMGYYGPGPGAVILVIIMFFLFILVLVAFGGAIQVLRILINHQILDRFTSRNMSIVHAVLMGVIPMYEPICLLIMSRRPYNPGMEPRVNRPIMQTPPPYMQPPQTPPYPAVAEMMPKGPVSTEPPVSDTPLQEPSATASEPAENSIGEENE